MFTSIKTPVLSICSAAFTFALNAQSEMLLHNVHFYESLESVKQKIGPNVLSHSVLTLDEPIFPLAEHSEAHLICTNLKTKNGTLAQVVFTFADNQLHLIESRGNALHVFFDSSKDSMDHFMGYQVVFEELLFGHIEKDIVWQMTKEASHPNLFTWENPYLTEGGPTSVAYNKSAEIPDFLEMGGPLNELKTALEANSTFIFERELDGSDPNAQLQLDCFGVEYAGFPRKMEARFGNGKLNTVWILTGKGEEDRIRKKLIHHYGNPVFTNEDWEIFENWTIGLRKDKPEILLLTPELGKSYKKEYFKQ
ncbi:MAG: hypothetical protein AAGC45_01660 [Bacteroidota bacterium]